MGSSIPRTAQHYKTDILREVRRADPDYDRESRVTAAYRFSNGRIFEEKMDAWGPYTPLPYTPSFAVVGPGGDITYD